MDSTLYKYVASVSGVTRSLVLAGHLLYGSRSHVLRARLRDMSGTNMVLLAGHVPGQAQPALAMPLASVCLLCSCDHFDIVQVSCLIQWDLYINLAIAYQL